MAERLKTAGHSAPSYLVQRMARTGVEMLVGIVNDRHFGPLIACGAGGVLVEVMQDVVVRLAPLSVEDTAEMIRGLKSYRVLQGFRGSPPADVAALEDVLARVSALAEDLPQIVELDCNPVIVYEQGQGAAIVDARVGVAPAAPRRPLGARR